MVRYSISNNIQKAWGFLQISIFLIAENVYELPGSIVNENATVICLKNLTDQFSQYSNSYSIDEPKVILKKASLDNVSESLYEQIWNQYTTVPLFLILIIGPLVNFKSATFFTKFNSLGLFNFFLLSRFENFFY